MAVMRARSGRSVRLRPRNLIFSFLLVFALAPRPAAAILHPLDGGGNFHSSVDVINRWVAEDRLDVLVIFEVANADLKFEEENGRMVARLRAEVRLTSLDGREIARKRQIRSSGMSPDDAASRTQHQVFGGSSAGSTTSTSARPAS
jgi:hypothetical protein